MKDAVHAILIVDDNEDIREMLAEFLHGEGYQVQTATNGLDALKKLRAEENLPCVILLDLMMPLMNGFQFLEAFRSDLRLSPIPVIVVSASGTLDPAQRVAISAPILPKPLDLARLLEVVGRLC